MKYKEIIEGIFLERPNRFIARVLVNGQEHLAHVKNTGRCKELLLPGAEIYLEDFENRMGKRKMRFSLIAVEKRRAMPASHELAVQPNALPTLLVNIDSQAPNQVVGEALASGKLFLPEFSSGSDGGIGLIKPETTFGDSRFDFYVEGADGSRAFIEVKGVTLEEDGVARFPDAPTERGVKHIQELIKAKDAGYGAYVVFVIQMKGVHMFTPNDKTHQAFGDALRTASKAGVQILAFDSLVTQDTLSLDKPVVVSL